MPDCFDEDDDFAAVLDLPGETEMPAPKNVETYCEAAQLGVWVGLTRTGRPTKSSEWIEKSAFLRMTGIKNYLVGDRFKLTATAELLK